MGILLKITLKTERKFVLISGPLVRIWCPVCRAESRFAGETEADRQLQELIEAADAHPLQIDRRRNLCLRTGSSEPDE